MSTMVHNVIYSASGGCTQQTSATPSVSGVGEVAGGGGGGGGGYSGAGQAIFSGGGGGGGYISMAYQHPLQQPHQHQQQVMLQHQQQILMKPGEQQQMLVGHGYPGVHHQHSYVPDSGPQQLQLPLTEPLLQPHQQQESLQLQQHVTMAIVAGAAADSPEMLTMCQGGGGGGGGSGRGGGTSKKRRNAPTVSTGRRSLKTEKVNPQETQRREKRRERNRVAAAKCRRKRQDRIECLSETVRDLEADNAQLEAAVSQLVGRRSQLIGEVRAHRLSCPDSAELAAAEALPLPLPPPMPPQRPPLSSSAATTTGSGDGNSTDGFGDGDDDDDDDEDGDGGSGSCPSRGGGGGLDSSFGSGVLGGALPPRRLPHPSASGVGDSRAGGAAFSSPQPPVMMLHFSGGEPAEEPDASDFLRL